MRNVQSPATDAIRYNYVQTIEKLKRQYEQENGPVTAEAYQRIQQQAYEINKSVIEACFIYEPTRPDESLFYYFTREGKSREYVMSLAHCDPETLRQMLIEEFIDTKPMSPGAAVLRNALETTVLNHSMDHASIAMQRVMKTGDYVAFSRRRPGQGEEINCRGDLIRNVRPEEFADILLRTAISPQRERLQDKTAGAMERFEGTVGEKHDQIRNLMINPNAVRMAMTRATDQGWQISRHADANIGQGLYASSDIGNVRANQEDSVLIMYHPQNPGFKMLVVSDGMGGLDSGEVASSFVIEEIAKWFNELPPEAFSARNTAALRMQYEEAIRQIDRRLHQDVMTERGGATFCGAIVTERDTIVSNVGDSRAYAYSQGNLVQLTADDSPAFDRYARRQIGKDDVRFQPDSNIITQAMGLEEPAQPRTTMIPNSSYDCLMLVSDGVSDCLSDMQIRAITQYTPRDRLAQMLIQEAKARDSIARDGREVKAGKDNATVAVYDNER